MPEYEYSCDDGVTGAGHDVVLQHRPIACIEPLVSAMLSSGRSMPLFLAKRAAAISRRGVQP